MTDSIIPLLPLCNSYLFLAKTVNVPCGKPSARLWSRSEISTSLSRELLYKKKSNSNYSCNKAQSNNDNEWGQRKLGLTKYTNHRICKGYKIKENTAQLKLKSPADT